MSSILCPPRAVVQILGLWYSGSSLLNLLFDSQPKIRGLGEAYEVYNGACVGGCSCGLSLATCAFYPKGDPATFYERCFDLYDCDVLVDASKEEGNFGNALCSYPRRMGVVLSKAPHEWIYSMRQHHPERDTSFATLGMHYKKFYMQHLLLAAQMQSQLFVTYGQMTEYPSEVVHQLCDVVGISFNPYTVQRWWQTNTHIIGGNSAVLFQVCGHKTMFQEHGKYAGREHTIFRDDHWKSDAAFCEESLKGYASADTEFDSLLRTLGHGGINEQIRIIMEKQSLAE
jgi:hypothetical protein